MDLVLEKLGEDGCRLHQNQGRTTEVPGFPVEIKNILGAGDAFAAGFLFGYAQGWDLYLAARMGNACGALVVTRHGFSISMPSYSKVIQFTQDFGSL